MFGKDCGVITGPWGSWWLWIGHICTSLLSQLRVACWSPSWRLTEHQEGMAYETGTQ